MPDDARPSGHSRRDLLSGRAIRHSIERRGEEIADELQARELRDSLSSGETVRLTTRAMACNFSVILNPTDDRRQVISASDALEFVHPLEDRLTVYRETSELLELNARAAEEPQPVEPDLFELLRTAVTIAEETGGAFTPTVRKLNQLWRTCRAEKSVPNETEIAAALAESDYRDLELDAERKTVFFRKPGLELDLSGIGKGFALDRVAAHLEQEQVGDFLLHGGHSSILARGTHNTRRGWPIGIRHPQAPHKRLGTLFLKETAFSASGSGVQFFRHEGKRYGHIFDPRTGWPVDHILTTVVLAPTATEADALSTAFYVLPLEETIAYCERHPEITALIFPQPKPGRKLEPVSVNLDEEGLVWG